MENTDWKNKMLDTIIKQLEVLGTEIQDNKTLTADEKLPQVDVLIHTLHFLQDFDENVAVLNDYWLKKNRAIKFNQIPDDRDR